jgi:hypothetical protein
LASPAAALAPDPPAPATSGLQKVYVIVGVNWNYNDEYSYAQGQYLTENIFIDKAAAERHCRKCIEQFYEEEDPDEFVMSDTALPESWNDWSRQERWQWLLGNASRADDEPGQFGDGYGEVEVPFEVREMTLPASAARQAQLQEEGS